MNQPSQTQAQTQTIEGFLEKDGFQLKYVIEGQGIPMLVIGSSIYYPRTFSQNLRSHLKLIFVDHRGFAKARDPDAVSPCSMDVLLEDIEAVRKTLALQKIVIAGHSGHAFLALEYAKKYPEAVSHVVLIATGTGNSEANAKLADQYFNETVAPERKAELERQLSFLPKDIESAPEKRFISFCIRLGPRSWQDPKFDATELWRGVSVNMKLIDHMWGELFRTVDVAAGLENLKQPVFIGLGLFDYLVAPHYCWNPLKSKFQQLSFRLFQRSSHCPQLEEPDLFDLELLQFIRNRS